jgi:NurA-like 5'-3' nuclease
MIYAVGDIHGCLDKLKNLLEREGITNNDKWAAGSAHLVFLGDYTDRGEDGIGVIEHIMKLEQEATSTGGQVTALLGNHDVILLEAFYFGDNIVQGFLQYGETITFHQMWLKNAGGQTHDLERLNEKHLEWLKNRPAMLVLNETLFIHADSKFYLEYGSSVQEINQSIGQILQDRVQNTVDKLEERFAKRMAFMHEEKSVPLEFAARFGAKRIVHGHTQISKLIECKPEDVLEPFVYAGGICTNLDHGLCYGGDGFIYRQS